MAGGREVGEAEQREDEHHRGADEGADRGDRGDYANGAEGLGVQQQAAQGLTLEYRLELVITSMDISICFADFPTEPITEVTRDYRQLGVGYANLGALLMATGHGYDSDGGRALAGR